MTKVLFVRSTPYDEDLNGYNVQGAGIARAFCKLGYDCDYLNYHSTDERTVDLLEYQGHKARVIFKKRKRILRTGICKEALQPEFLSQYDVVISREYNQLMTHLIAKRHPNTSMYTGPYYNMFMLPFVSVFYDALYTRKLDRELKCKFVKSELAKEYLEKKGYTDLINVGVGLDITRFDNVECTESTREIADYMKANNCILYIGTLEARKNIPFILKVFEKVLSDRPDTKLIMIGKSEQTLFNKLIGRKNESYFEDLMKNVPENVKNAIWHINRVDNPQLQFIYPLAKAFILPSIKEIFGMVLLEAMYFDSPVVTSRNGGSTTLIKDESFGQEIAEFDVDKWEAAILRYLDDADYAAQVKQNARSNIIENYTWEPIVSKMMDYIEKSNK